MDCRSGAEGGRTTVVVTLHCLAPSQPRFFHQAALTALLRGLLRDAPDYDLHLRIDTPESGRVDYRPGDYYRFLLIALRGGAPPPLACPHGHLFWVDNEYRDAEGADQVMGGLSGLLHLEGRLSPAWWRLLILGQYVGMGQRTAFGFGRYQLRTADGGFSYRRPLPAASLLTRALQALSPAVESLFSAGVHGYRPGRSRITASHAIQAAWRAGYRWVYESDVRDFLDSVNLGRLRERLSALFGDDPVVDAVGAWLAAPVRFQGERIERVNGLPQGSPLSPLREHRARDRAPVLERLLPPGPGASRRARLRPHGALSPCRRAGRPHRHRPRRVHP